MNMTEEATLQLRIRRTVVAVVITTVVSGCATFSEEGRAWEQAKRYDTVTVYEQFLRDYPTSSYRSQAETRLAASVAKLNAAFPDKWRTIQQLTFSKTNASWLIQHMIIQGRLYEDIFSMPILEFCDTYPTRPETAKLLQEFFSYATEITPPKPGCTTSGVLGKFWPKDLQSGTIIVNGQRHCKFVYPNIDVMAVVVGSRGNRMIEIYHDNKFWSLYEQSGKGIVALSSLGKL
ncbi:MAG: hypothetical protein ACOX5G_10575 [Kiritimatiellia bacterium]|jgi:hypothetical protein